MSNLDTYGLSCNPNASKEDLTRAKWHGDCDREAVPEWHAVAYLTLMSSSIFVMIDQGTNEEIDKGQVIGDV